MGVRANATSGSLPSTHTTGRASAKPTGRTAAAAGGKFETVAFASGAIEQPQSTTATPAVSRGDAPAKEHASHREIFTDRSTSSQKT
jgi:hypothetical protein